MRESPDLILYNSLTRQKELFSPASDDAVRIYTCGPTVYDYSHIGNMRSYIFMDILRRVLKRRGYKLLHVMNITDVGHLVSDEDTGEDKMLKGARERNKSPWEIAEEFTRVFFEDTASLNINVPEVVSKATDHITQMLEAVIKLVEKGFGYELSDGIYFDIKRFAGYGMLSRANLDEQLAGARVDVNPDKRNPADFALWIKAPKEHIMRWDSPWGDGYPGWHIECSAMSMHYLGDKIDIHTGGVDHIPVHHENEIAQSDALVGRRVVDRWMHGEFLMIDNGKMSKSLKNNYTVSDIRGKNYNPLAFRYFCLNGHYRNKLNFTWDAMHAASVAYKRFVDGALSHLNAENIDILTIDKFRDEFEAAIYDDLNIPKALGAAWQVVRYPVKSKMLYDLLLDMDGVLGLGLDAAANSGLPCVSSDEEVLPNEVIALLKARADARSAKDWQKSDELRDRIKDLGYAVLDGKNGIKVERI